MCNRSYFLKCSSNPSNYSCPLNTTRTNSTFLFSETTGTVSRQTYVSGNTGIISVFLEQDKCLWNYWHNKCVAGTSGMVVIHPMPVDRRHPTTTNPSWMPQFPWKTITAHSMLDGANQERSWLLSQFRHWWRDIGATIPEESREQQWPGFSLQRKVNIHRLLITADQWCGGCHLSQRVSNAPGQIHRHHLHP